MKRRIQLLAGLLIALFLLWFLFRGTDWAAVWETTLQTKWGWLIACEAFIVASFFTRVYRWSFIVRTAKPVSYNDLFNATQIGFLANFVLPLRMGEAIRALALARLVNLPFTKCFAFVALDRLTDLIGLIAMMLIGALVYTPAADIILPPEIYAHPISSSIVRGAALSVAAAFSVLLAGMVAFYFAQDFALRLVGFFAPIGAAVLRGLLLGLLWLPGLLMPKPAGKVREKVDILLGPAFTPHIQCMVGHFAAGMHIFRSSADMLKTVFYSIVTWLLLTGSYYSALNAFSLDVPWYTSFLVVAMLSAMISMPSTPGFIGPFHAGIMAGILLSEPTLTNDLNAVKAAAIITHVAHTLPVLVVGVYSLYATKFGLLELRREGEEAQEEVTGKE